MTVTNANASTDSAPANAINTPPNSPNSATAPGAAIATAENKKSMRKLLDGQKYPVAKGDIIKKVFDH